jgi:DNA-binding response OmpR family regulator
VVEDEMTVAMLIEDMVSELAYDVAAVVPRLEDAMRLLDSDTFDVAMLDVHLNGKTVFPSPPNCRRAKFPSCSPPPMARAASRRNSRTIRCCRSLSDLSSCGAL